MLADELIPHQARTMDSWSGSSHYYHFPLMNGVRVPLAMVTGVDGQGEYPPCIPWGLELVFMTSPARALVMVCRSPNTHRCSGVTLGVSSTWEGFVEAHQCLETGASKLKSNLSGSISQVNQSMWRNNMRAPALVILFLRSAGEFVIHDPGELLKQRRLLLKKVLIVESTWDLTWYVCG